LEDEIGVGWAEGVHPQDFQRCMDLYMRAFGRRERFEMEYRLLRADGAWRWILDRGVPRTTPFGEFAGYVGSCVDITEHKLLENELRQRVKDRDDFLSIASHELKTPLTTMQFAIDAVIRAIRDRPEEAFRSGKMLAAAQRAAGQTVRLSVLVEELLDVSRLASSPLTLDRTRADLSSVAREVLARVADAAAAAGCAVELDAPDPVTGMWDLRRIERALANLVSNALKYGGEKPVVVTVEARDGCARLIVEDQGIGIPRERQAAIFGRFERAVSERHYGGLGLGLWISRQCVLALGGEIRFESEEGKGTKFFVDLPFSAAAESSGLLTTG